MVRTRLVLGLGLLTLAVVGCARDSEESASAEGAATEIAPFDPYDYDIWQWKEGHPGCGLGRIGRNIATAVKGARHNLDIMPGGKNDPRWVTTRNVAGPAMLDSNEMFPALRTLISRAQHEVDLQWHVIDADSDGFDEVIKGIASLNERLKRGETRGPVTVRVVSPAWIFKGSSTGKLAAAIKAQVPQLSDKLTVKIAAKKYFGLATTHVKMAVIDGAIVHAGGGNLSNAQNFKRLRADGRVATDAQFKQLHEQTKVLLRPGVPTTFDAVRTLPLKRPERDSAYVVKGQVASAALAQFDQMWNERSTAVSDCTPMWTEGAAKCKSVKDKLTRTAPAATSKPSSTPTSTRTACPRAPACRWCSWRRRRPRTSSTSAATTRSPRASTPGSTRPSPRSASRRPTSTTCRSSSCARP